MQDHDAAAESLADRATALQKDIESRNIYQENLKELNDVAGHRPKSTLVLGEWWMIFTSVSEGMEFLPALNMVTHHTYVVLQSGVQLCVDFTNEFIKVQKVNIINCHFIEQFISKH